MLLLLQSLAWYICRYILTWSFVIQSISFLCFMFLLLVIVSVRFSLFSSIFIISITLYLVSSLSRAFIYNVLCSLCTRQNVVVVLSLFPYMCVYLMKFLEKRSSYCIDVRALYSFCVPFIEIFRFRFYISFFFILWHFFLVNTVLAWLNATTVIYINVWWM